MQTSLKTKIIESLNEAPKSAYVLAEEFGTTPSSIRRRITDLKRQGRVQSIQTDSFIGASGQTVVEKLWSLTA